MDVGKHLKKKFLTGLFILIPLLVTAYVIYLIVSTVDMVISPVLKNLTLQVTGQELYVPGAGFFLFLAFVYAAGVLASNYMGKRILVYGESMLRKIPFVKGVYSSVKDMTTAFSAEKAESFQGVVLTEFPFPGRFAVGFITNRACTIEGQNFCTVFIPTTPNPTSGYLVMVREEELKFLDLPVDRALRYIVSLGTSTTELPWTRKY
jgi:uncharacterized membrane protein